MNKLSEKKCVPCEGGVLALDISEIHKYQKKIGSYINGNPKDKNNREYLNIITPSNWSKNGLIACGFDDNQVNVIPHGVDIKTFHKISDE